MRIITGSARGRRLVGPPGLETRPPTDRLREALFSSLGRTVEGASTIDLYAGTGSFGLEALSRGAKSATFVERDRRALQALRSNIASVGLGGRVIAGSVENALRRETARYDLAFVDPPYALAGTSVDTVLDLLTGVLDGRATILLRRRRDDGPGAPPGTLRLSNRRRYGDAEVWWYTKEAQ
jgi:16S rRNA (guanine966-N2)-methyltransferase